MRAFIAVQIRPSDYLSGVFNEFSRIKGIKVVEHTNIHLTIKFLGEIDERKTKEICEGIKNLRAHEFDIETEGIGAFPSMSRPRVIYVDCRSDGLYQLLAEVGKFVTLEKDFVPHITIGRVKQKIIMPHIEFKSEKYHIDEVCLFSSDLRPSGPVYTKVCCNKLAPQASE